MKNVSILPIKVLSAHAVSMMHCIVCVMMRVRVSAGEGDAGEV